MTALYRQKQFNCDWGEIRTSDDFGVRVVDLARPPLRFWAAGEQAHPPAVLQNQSVRQVQALPLPVHVLSELGESDNWQAMTRRSLLRLLSWFLIAEDPQRRLDASEVASLAHQASLVRHVLSDTTLRNVLIADEVGLGKTVEAGLIIRELLEQSSKLRVLYLAPARLVRNVEREFRQLGLGFRIWVAGNDSDARLTDSRVIASIHRAVSPSHYDEFSQTRWDVVVVDECHHLSNYSKEGHSPLRKYRLIDELRTRLSPEGRLILLSGTPHQGHPHRFTNLLRLLQRPSESHEAVAGRVIYRTKEDVTDWRGRPLFPKRSVRPPVVVDLGAGHRDWLKAIHEYFESDNSRDQNDAGRRAATWRCAQALQWATSSIEAGLGYLVRQAIRAECTLSLPHLCDALMALRPYRGGSAEESPAQTFARIAKEVRHQTREADIEDIEEAADDEEEAEGWVPDPKQLSALLQQGVALLAADPDAKWNFLWDRVLADALDEKVVLFAQPIETVTALSRYLERRTGQRPALIVGNQSDEERKREVDSFWKDDGPRYLVSSRAGGEGINLQVARRLVHIDVPWNPMEMEQRVGRVHRFKSRRTILVDTLVTKDSREADVYDVARQKLEIIASQLGSPDRAEAIFARVMALVPPDELLQVMGRGPLSPLSEQDRSDIERLVTAGHERWSAFDRSYRNQQQKIRALEPGQATWADIAWLAKRYLSAMPADGYKVLRFVHQGEEVADASEAAEVLRVEGRDRAVGDYGGMPITGPGGVPATLLGLNTEPLCSTLKRFAFGEERVGAAHVRWPDNVPPPAGLGPSPFGLLFYAKQTLRLTGSDPVETALGLHAYAVDLERSVELEPDVRARTVRALVEATVRQKPEDAPQLVERLRELDATILQGLRRPTEAELENQVRHVVYPLLAAVVG